MSFSLFVNFNLSTGTIFLVLRKPKWVINVPKLETTNRKISHILLFIQPTFYIRVSFFVYLGKLHILLEPWTDLGIPDRGLYNFTC